jgi:quercetin dioxygenase-like cupin family protein
MIVTPADGRWLVLVTGDRTGGRFSALEIRVLQGAEPPRHVHSREDEVVYVIEGHVTFTLEDERLDGPAGSSLVLPRGKEHTLSVETPEARLLVLLLPAGLEGWVLDLDRQDANVPDEQAVERLVASAARYGVAITGPARPPQRSTFATSGAGSQKSGVNARSNDDRVRIDRQGGKGQ